MAASVPDTAARNSTDSMKWIKYSRYTGEDFGIDSEDLLRALSRLADQFPYH